MVVALSAAWVAASITFYPAYGDAVRQPRDLGPTRLEAVIDKGLTAELIVACPKGTAILAYSKVERVYCGPKKGCTRSLSEAAHKACGIERKRGRD